jgi:hypothetical protein
MTYYLSFRSDMRAGSVKNPQLYEGIAGSEDLKEVPKLKVPELFRQRDVLFVTHGFNVNGARGINALGRFEQRFAATGSERCIGVLWPGDWWIPAINYPFEASDAVDCGKRLAAFCKTNAADALSLSFMSHSLGGRVMLEAVTRLDRKARLLCLAAAAVDDDCLKRQYAGAVKNCERIVNLASKADRVLRYAYPAGDFFSDIFGDDDSPVVGALGRYGPRGSREANVNPREIPKRLGYDHGNYLPPSDQVMPPPVPAGEPNWEMATEFMIRAYRYQNQDWPPAS